MKCEAIVVPIISIYYTLTEYYNYSSVSGLLLQNNAALLYPQGNNNSTVYRI